MQSTGFDLDTEWEPRRVEPTCPWPVDIAHLARYTLGDKALEQEVLDLFAAETSNQIEAFKRAQSDKDWKMAAHTLKGSGRAIGAWRLAQAAQEAERLAGVQDTEACAAAIRRVEEATAEVLAYITRFYPSRDVPLKKSA